MDPIPRLLIFAGLLLMGLGLVWHFGGRLLHLGKLPGDIVIERGNFRFYFPWVTSLLLSILFSLILTLVAILFRHR